MSSELFVKLYPIENILKLAFIPMSLFNLNHTVTIAIVVSVLALLRMLKMPQFNKEYLAYINSLI